jgi:hypothetical protein
MADGLGTIARTKRILIICTIGWLFLIDAIRYQPYAISSSSFGCGGPFHHYIASWYSEPRTESLCVRE